MVKQFCCLTAFVVALALTTTVPSKLAAQSDGQKVAASSGTQFLLCFEQNSDPNLTGTLDDGYLEIWLAAPNGDATVTVTCNNYPELNQVFQVAKGSSAVYRVTTDTPLGVTDSLSDLWIITSEQVDNRVLQVNSTAPILCAGMDFKSKSADATLALPLSSAGTDYRIMAYANCPSLNTPSQFVVAAFEDSTHVTITPSAPTVGGVDAGTPINMTINKGQCVQVQTDGSTAGLDLTGSQVHSDKPVAVYAGQAKTDIPAGAGTRDMLLEAMPPVNTWGKLFVLDALDVDNTDNDGSQQLGGAMLRVVAMNPNTAISVNGTPWVTLNANEYEDTIVYEPSMVESSEPILAGNYGSTFGPLGTTEANGDPFLAVLPAADQVYNDCTFFTSTDSDNFLVQKVVIVVDTAAESSILVDGYHIPASDYLPVPNASNGRAFDMAEYNVSPGVHTVKSNPEHGGFTAMVYGFGTVIGYGYGILPSTLPPLSVPTQSFGALSCSLQAYPNPARGTVTVLTTTPAKTSAMLYLYNPLGELLRSFTVKPGDEERSLKVSDLSAGVYFLRLCPASGDVITRQIVVAP